MAQKRKYPIGNHDFPEIREQGFLYIDKTDYVFQMTHACYKYVFLSRPRRFGKSLLTTTLRAYFEGRKELFKGLAIDSLETEWKQYPVLHFDMSLGKGLEKDALERTLLDQLNDNEKRMGVEGIGNDTNTRLKNLIINTYAKTGSQVVVLIDEYDSPLLDIVHEQETLPVIRKVMTNFYSPLKACGQYLRFCFLTGITKFSQLSIFSALNNIVNISMEPDYAGICGITKEELLSQMQPDIEHLAQKIGVTPQETLDNLVEYYDGYHFAYDSPDIFNPYSLLNAFSMGRIKAYWFATGTPTFLIEVLRKNNVMPSEIGNIDAVEEDFDAPTESMTGTTALMYQSGYLTIKDYDPAGVYTLGIPNKEIRLGLMRSLLPYYVQLPPERGSVAIVRMYKALRVDDMDAALKELQQYLASVPQTDNTSYEGHYQQVLYIIFSMLGLYVDVEVRTALGRVDVVMRTPSRLYIIELKMGKDAETAMSQIDLKKYPERFYNCGLPRVKVGVNFNKELRNITDWLIASV